jgi:hypothetical protein
MMEDIEADFFAADRVSWGERAVIAAGFSSSMLDSLNIFCICSRT